MTRSGDSWLIYGATGYTGRLVADRARAAGLRPTLAGRSGPSLAVPLDDERALRAAVAGHALVANCAGPFARTSAPLVDACVAAGTHYLDITGEIPVFESILALDAAARAAGVTLLTGAGFDVVPTDCLAGLLHAALPDATSLELAFDAPGGTSRGTAITALSAIATGGLRRIGGALRPTPFGVPAREVPFPSGTRWAGALSWGDLATAYHSTGIPDITVYSPLAPHGLVARLAPLAGAALRLPGAQPLAERLIRRRRPGPSPQTRARTGFEVWGEVRDAAGTTRTATLTGPNAYTFTADAVIAAVTRILSGTTPPGAHTPATALGPDFITTLPHTTLTPPHAPT
jgi:saccharopine dehydrogenase (NAD+, L-lysine-forming)